MIRPLGAAAVAAVLALIPACQPVPALLLAGGALAAASDAYCAGVTEQGKQTLRDRVSGGRPLVACLPEAR